VVASKKEPHHTPTCNVAATSARGPLLACSVATTSARGPPPR